MYKEMKEKAILMRKKGMKPTGKPSKKSKQQLAMAARATGA